LFFIVSLLLSVNVYGQSSLPPSAIICEMGTMRGDKRDAIKAKRHDYSGRMFIARLGYIDTNFTTLTHAQNNVEIGLVALPEDRGCTVLSYEFATLPKRGDFVGPYKLNDNGLYGANLSVNVSLDRIKTGDKLFFTSIKAKCRGKEMSFSLPDFTITVVTDSAYEKMLPQVR